jgi:hypothetical protein
MSEAPAERENKIRWQARMIFRANGILCKNALFIGKFNGSCWRIDIIQDADLVEQVITDYLITRVVTQLLIFLIFSGTIETQACGRQNLQPLYRNRFAAKLTLAVAA